MASTTYTPGQILTRTDLNIFLVDNTNTPIVAYEIYYAIFYVDPDTLMEVLIGSAMRTPLNPSPGEYWAAIQIPPGALSGTYRIRWYFKRYANSAQQTVTQEFSVVAEEQAGVVVYSPARADLIRQLRMLLRDQAPDKFYHFRPPEHEARIGHYDRVFGRIWEDEELSLYLDRALDWLNMFPPLTYIPSIEQLVIQMPQWRTALLWGAIVHAMFAIATNWVADEFSYSIGGISLDIDKSSKYESLKQNAEGQLEKFSTDAKPNTVKYTKGLQQPRFGLGVRSSFGPAVGKGVLSPRSFI